MTRRRHPRTVMVDVIECSPLTHALGDVGRERLTEIWKPTEEESAMSNPATPINPNDRIVRRYEVDQAVQQAVRGLVSETDLLESLASLETQFNERIDVLRNAVQEVTDAVLAVGTNRTDLNDRMVRFLESHPGVKFPPYAVAENIGHADGREAGKRLKALANAGRVSVDAKPNHRPLYFVKG